MENQEIVRYFDELVKKDASTGKFRLNPPGSGNLVLTNSRVTGALESRIFFDFFNPEEKIPGLDFLIKALDDFYSHLGEFVFPNSQNRKKPVLEINPALSIKDIVLPRLGSYYSDPRVIINIVKDVGLEYSISGELVYKNLSEDNILIAGIQGVSSVKPSMEYEFSYLFYKHPLVSLAQRRNNPLHLSGGRWIIEDRVREIREEVDTYLSDSKLEVERYPVVFNSDIKNMLSRANKLVGFVYNILLQQLEPFTTEHLKQELSFTGYNITQEEYYKIVSNVLAEESIVARSLVNEWFYSSYKNGFTQKEIKEYSGMRKTDRDNSALSAVALKGPNEVLRFYSSQDWDINRFLSRSF